MKTLPVQANYLGRSAGVLLHPTCLPGGEGIGDLGPGSHRFVDLLAKAGQSWWQMLPLGPPGDGNSPYRCFSAFAGNPILISGESLAADGLLRRRDLRETVFPEGDVNFSRVVPFKLSLLLRAAENFNASARHPLREAFEGFRVEHRGWLDDYALFMALREANGCRHWSAWPGEFVCREPGALRGARRELASAIQTHQFMQFLFDRQLRDLRAHARRAGIRFFGDLPIFVSDDSADVWANPQLFLLDKDRRPKFVSGVPPDIFSRSGQRWGNPLYDWEKMRQDGFRWWVDRFRSATSQAELVRIDHFRGFAACWAIPSGRPDARVGRWLKAPGKELFTAVGEALDGLPFVAEDLGHITPDVEALRREMKLPGMKVLQFAFGGDPSNPYLPHNHSMSDVVYTGTHDNPTTRGWYRSLSARDRAHLQKYLPVNERTVSDRLIALAWSSVGQLAIAPLQDVLNLGARARMNVPGSSEGNWRWRVTTAQLKSPWPEQLAGLTATYARSSPKPPARRGYRDGNSLKT